jgi:sensor histidine kinase regulating citrate/malate metabolism
MHGRLQPYTDAFQPQLRIGVFVLALIIPLLLFAAVLFTQFSQSERSRYETEALEVARRLTAVLDRDLAKIQSALEALATSRLIWSENLSELYEQANELSRLIGAPIVIKHP